DGRTVQRDLVHRLGIQVDVAVRSRPVAVKPDHRRRPEGLRTASQGQFDAIGIDPEQPGAFARLVPGDLGDRHLRPLLKSSNDSLYHGCWEVRVRPDSRSTAYATSHALPLECERSQQADTIYRAISTNDDMIPQAD